MTETLLLIAYADGMDCFRTSRATAPWGSHVIRQMVNRECATDSTLMLPILKAWRAGQTDASVSA